LRDDLATYIRARYTLVYLLSYEEQRVLDELERFADAEHKQLITWTHARGLRGAGIRPGTAQRSPNAFLDAVPTLPDNALIVACDFHPFLGDPLIVRQVKELGHDLESTKKTMLFLSPLLKLPVELSKDVVVVDFALPDYALLESTFREIASSLTGDKAVKLSDPDREKLIRSAQGLTLKEFSNVLAKTLVTAGRIDRGAVDVVNTEKKQIIRKSGILEFHSAGESMSSVGGLENLKEWLVQRGQAFSDRARSFGLPWPKGILIVGVQGCGKSLSAKAVADSWKLPLLKLDMGRLFGGMVGASEENMRMAISIAESIAPAVLWIDEIEKGLSGLGSSNVSDGGTTARVIGTFLTWMQEKTAPIFVIATSNDISAMPPELLRKGRFDEIFFVDLPTIAERRIIFEIHIKRRNRRPADYDLDGLAQATRGYSGAEIEAAVVAGMFRAFQEGHELTSDDILCACRETVPLSVVMEEKIVKLREWSRLRTRNASAEESIPVEETRTTIAERLQRIAGDN
jgi:SpoVK/Ycf46/Vps4 family AAA+-type ATPase